MCQFSSSDGRFPQNTTRTSVKNIQESQLLDALDGQNSGHEPTKVIQEDFT